MPEPKLAKIYIAEENAFCEKELYNLYNNCDAPEGSPEKACCRRLLNQARSAFAKAWAGRYHTDDFEASY